MVSTADSDSAGFGSNPDIPTNTEEVGMCRSLTKNSRCNEGSLRYTGRRLETCVGILYWAMLCNG